MSDFNFQIIEGHQTLTSSMAFVLSKLDREFFPTPWNLDSWQNLFHEHDRLLVVVQLEDQVIGFCLFDKVIADSFAHLLKILIHPDFRVRGVSTKLLSKALTQLEKEGCTQLFLEVEENNLAAQKLYSSQGFRKIHVKKDFYGANRGAVIMTKGQ